MQAMPLSRPKNGAGGSEQVGMSLYSVDGYVGAYGTAHRAVHVVVDTSGTVEIYFGDIAGKVAKLQYSSSSIYCGEISSSVSISVLIPEVKNLLHNLSGIHQSPLDLGAAAIGNQFHSLNIFISRKFSNNFY